MEPEQHQNVLYIERERCGCGGRTTTTERLLWSQQLLLLTSPPAQSPTRTSHNKLLQDCKSEIRQKSGRRELSNNSEDRDERRCRRIFAFVGTTTTTRSSHLPRNFVTGSYFFLQFLQIYKWPLLQIYKWFK